MLKLATNPDIPKPTIKTKDDLSACCEDIVYWYGESGFVTNRKHAVYGRCAGCQRVVDPVPDQVTELKDYKLVTMVEQPRKPWRNPDAHLGGVR